MAKSPQRRSLSKKLRFEVFKRDRFHCTYCGRTLPDVVLVVDHVVPVAEGGTDEIANLTTSCFDCNAGKGATPLGEVAPLLDEMAALEALQEMAERRIGLRLQIAANHEQEEALADVVSLCRAWWFDATGWDTGVAARSVESFLAAGLTVEDLRLAMLRIAEKMNGHHPLSTPGDAWRYLCGYCWNRVREARR